MFWACPSGRSFWDSLPGNAFGFLRGVGGKKRGEDCLDLPGATGTGVTCMQIGQWKNEQTDAI